MIEINNQTKSRLDKKEIAKTIERFLKKFKLEKKDVSVAFVGSARMKSLNKSYRGQDKTTDVLSFAGSGDLLGEIIIDYSQIKKQAKSFSQSVKQELNFILIHALLHLVGYDDETEKGNKEMIALGEDLIKRLKI